jgi:20S proteasome alpha/beta subunit
LWFLGCQQCTALIVDTMDDSIWQVDPSGQLWKCQVAIAGKGARQVQTKLVETIRSLLCNNNTSNQTAVDSSNNSTINDDPYNDEINPFLQKMSVKQVTELALECIWQTNDHGESSKLPLLDTLTFKVSTSAISIMLDGVPCHVLFLPANGATTSRKAPAQ